MQIARFPEVITMIEEEDKIDEIWEELKPLISSSLDMMINMREVEGEKLKEDILIKINQKRGIFYGKKESSHYQRHRRGTWNLPVHCLYDPQ